MVQSSRVLFLLVATLVLCSVSAQSCPAGLAWTYDVLSGTPNMPTDFVARNMAFDKSRKIMYIAGETVASKATVIECAAPYSNPCIVHHLDAYVGVPNRRMSGGRVVYDDLNDKLIHVSTDGDANDRLVAVICQAPSLQTASCYIRYISSMLSEDDGYEPHPFIVDKKLFVVSLVNSLGSQRLAFHTCSGLDASFCIRKTIFTWNYAESIAVAVNADTKWVVATGLITTAVSTSLSTSRRRVWGGTSDDRRRASSTTQSVAAFGCNTSPIISTTECKQEPLINANDELLATTSAIVARSDNTLLSVARNHQNELEVSECNTLLTSCSTRTLATVGLLTGAPAVLYDAITQRLHILTTRLADRHLLHTECDALPFTLDSCVTTDMSLGVSFDDPTATSSNDVSPPLIAHDPTADALIFSASAQSIPHLWSCADTSALVPCASSPCQHPSATCTNAPLNQFSAPGALAFTCACPSGFAGALCDIEVDAAFAEVASNDISSLASASATLVELSELSLTSVYSAAMHSSAAAMHLVAALQHVADFTLTLSLNLTSVLAEHIVDTTLVSDIVSEQPSSLAESTLAMTNALLSNNASRTWLVEQTNQGPTLARVVETCLRTLALNSTCNAPVPTMLFHEAFSLNYKRVSSMNAVTGTFSINGSSITVPDRFPSEYVASTAPALLAAPCSIPLELAVYARSPFPARLALGESSLGTTVFLDSPIVSFTAGAGSVLGLSDDASIAIELTVGSELVVTKQVNGVDVELTAAELAARRGCFFWSYTLDGWSSSGCRKTHETRETVTCRCNHLTNFAVLFQGDATTTESHHQTNSPSAHDGINECASAPCLNGGNCTDGSGSFICDCPMGYSGFLCEQNIDECVSSPCAPEATCVSNLNSFVCLCQPGFTGALCLEDIDECLSQPCLNGGSCSNHHGAFACACPDTFEGFTCAEPFDPCRSNPCYDDAICVASPGVSANFVCTCPPGFVGVQCEQNFDECASQPCFDGATCVDGVNSFICVCPSMRFGLLCNQLVDPCLSQPCPATHVCLPSPTTVAAHVCECPRGFMGTTCAIEIDECASQPCLNGASCVDALAGYHCACAAGWTGLHCTRNIDECASQPCLNGATCVDLPNGFVCNCEPGLEGTVCDQVVDSCESSPCHNGGACSLIAPLQLVCECPIGYEGVFCERQTDYCVSNPCQNGAVCVSQHATGSFACVCASSFAGDYCQVALGYAVLLSIGADHMDLTQHQYAEAGLVAVDVPANSLAETLALTVGVADDQSPRTNEPFARRASVVFTLSPATTFLKPVRITVPVGARSRASRFSVFYRAEGATHWERALEPSENLDAGTVTAGLMHFSELIAYYEPVDDALAKATQVFTWLGGVLSVLCCSALIVVFLLFPSLRTIPVKFIMNLCVALIGVNVLFLGGIDRTESRAGCTTVKLALYYFLLATFSWMTAIALHLYRSLVRGHNIKNEKRIMLGTTIVAWLVPVVPVFVVTMIDVQTDMSTTGQSVCWFTTGSTPNALLYAFLIPVAVMLAANMIMLIGCYVALAKSRLRLRRQIGEKNLAGSSQLLRACIILAATVGLTWVVAYIALAVDVRGLWLVFALCNGFQGVWLFIAYCLGRRVRTEIRKGFTEWRTRQMSTSGLRKGTSGSDEGDVDIMVRGSTKSSGKSSKKEKKKRKKRRGSTTEEMDDEEMQRSIQYLMQNEESGSHSSSGMGILLRDMTHGRLTSVWDPEEVSRSVRNKTAKYDVETAMTDSMWMAIEDEMLRDETYNQSEGLDDMSPRAGRLQSNPEFSDDPTRGLLGALSSSSPPSSASPIKRFKQSRPSPIVTSSLSTFDSGWNMSEVSYCDNTTNSSMMATPPDSRYQQLAQVDSPLPSASPKSPRRTSLSLFRRTNTKSSSSKALSNATPMQSIPSYLVHSDSSPAWTESLQL